MLGAMSSVLVAVGLVVVFFVGAVVTVMKRGREVQALAERGRLARGRVTARRSTAPRGGRRRSHRVQLMYEMPDTGERRRWIGVTSGQWEQLTEGVAVDVVYLPDSPDVFALRGLVNDARRAKGMSEI